MRADSTTTTTTVFVIGSRPRTSVRPNRTTAGQRAGRDPNAPARAAATRTVVIITRSRAVGRNRPIHRQIVTNDQTNRAAPIATTRVVPRTTGRSRVHRLVGRTINRTASITTLRIATSTAIATTATTAMAIIARPATGTVAVVPVTLVTSASHRNRTRAVNQRVTQYRHAKPLRVIVRQQTAGDHIQVADGHRPVQPNNSTIRDRKRLFGVQKTRRLQFQNPPVCHRHIIERVGRRQRSQRTAVVRIVNMQITPVLRRRFQKDRPRTTPPITLTAVRRGRSCKRLCVVFDGDSATAATTTVLVIRLRTRAPVRLNHTTPGPGQRASRDPNAPTRPASARAVVIIARSRPVGRDRPIHRQIAANDQTNRAAPIATTRVVPRTAGRSQVLWCRHRTINRTAPITTLRITSVAAVTTTTTTAMGIIARTATRTVAVAPVTLVTSTIHRDRTRAVDQHVT